MIEVKEVKTKKEQKQFLNFALDLYKGNPYFVPPLYSDEKKMFGKNYVYNSSCDWTAFLAYEDGKPVGRIQCIIQKDANAKNGEKRCRFSRFDAIENLEVSRALFEKAETWAREKGMDTVVGPLNFSDLEREGLLVEGFEEPSTFEQNYNFPYYKEHLEALGYVKEIDWTASRLYGPESQETMDELEKLVAFIFKRYKLHYGTSKSGPDLLRKYSEGIFDLIDTSYEGLYGTVPFTEGMRRLILDNFAIVINPKHTAVILDENEKIVCFGLSFPGLANALVGTRGKYTPLTLIKLLYAIKRPQIIDLCLVGVDPEYLNRGISGALSLAIMKMLRDNPRLKWADTNLNLEDNYAILNQWHRFQREECKRYRAYVKKLSF
jgi:GNAT superfamily N-acetyltransferase